MTLETIKDSIKKFNDAAWELRKNIEQYDSEEKVINDEELSELRRDILIGEGNGAMASSKLWEYQRENPHSHRMVKR